MHFVGLFLSSLEFFVHEIFFVINISFLVWFKVILFSSQEESDVV